jgi:hypothetical protein
LFFIISLISERDTFTESRFCIVWFITPINFKNTNINHTHHKKQSVRNSAHEENNKRFFRTDKSKKSAIPTLKKDANINPTLIISHSKVWRFMLSKNFSILVNILPSIIFIRGNIKFMLV